MWADCLGAVRQDATNWGDQRVCFTQHMLQTIFSDLVHGGGVRLNPPKTGRDEAQPQCRSGWAYGAFHNVNDRRVNPTHQLYFKTTLC